MRIYNKVTIPIFDSNKFSKLIDKNSNNLLTYFDFVLTLLELHRNFPTSFNYGKALLVLRTDKQLYTLNPMVY